MNTKDSLPTEVKRRNTKQRELVLGVVRAHTDHPTADRIFEEAHRLDEKISRGTVYRNLSILSHSGEILHIRVPGADRYDLNTSLHYHFFCVKCRGVWDLPFEYTPAHDKMLSDLTGYEVFRHRLLFEGLCPNCKNK